MAKKKTEQEPTLKNELIKRVHGEYEDWMAKHTEICYAYTHPAEIYAMSYVSENVADIVTDEELVKNMLGCKEDVCQLIAQAVAFHLEFSIHGELEDVITSAAMSIEPANGASAEAKLKYYKVDLRCTDHSCADTTTCMVADCEPTKEQAAEFLKKDFECHFPNAKWAYVVEDLTEITKDEADRDFDMDIRQDYDIFGYDVPAKETL